MGKKPNQIWGVGAVVLPDEGTWIPLLHERPAMPEHLLLDMKQQLRASGVESHTETVLFLASTLIRMIKEFLASGGLPHPSSKKAHNLSAAIMCLSQISGHRYWLVDAGQRSFQPINAASPDQAKEAIRGLIQQALGPSSRTIH